MATNPWQPASVSHTGQALVGGTWTNEQQLSLLVEAWWDGTALSDSQWNAWNARGAHLGTLAGLAPPQAVAGNLAWQASAFGASSNLRRTNLFARLSWQYDKWQPAIDVLYAPADAGRIVTASLGWQGDRVHIPVRASTAARRARCSPRCRRDASSTSPAPGRSRRSSSSVSITSLWTHGRDK